MTAASVGDSATQSVAGPRTGSVVPGAPVWTGLSRSAADLAAMEAVKRVLDPLGLLNPGVLFPRRTSC